VQVAPAEILINAIGLSALYVMVAVGLTLAFGVMRILNFAHGELYMVGAYGAWIFYAQGVLPFPAAVAVSAAIVSGVGLIIERGVFRPLREAPFSGLLGAIGVMFILQVFVGQVWGLGLNKIVPLAYPEIFHILGATLSVHRLIVIVAGFSILVGIWFFLKRSKLGLAMRACSMDAEAASLQGIGANRTRVVTMAMSGALAGLAGALIAPTIIVNPYIGGAVILKAFVIIIVGGMGSFEGAILAAFLFGFMDVGITTIADGTIANMVGLMFMFIILAFRPRGLLGREV
jgi:branched-chain amino acid transport system permease protein